MTLAHLEALALAATPMPDRQKRWFVEGDTIYWQALQDGQPTTVPQTFIEANIASKGLEFTAAANPETVLALVAVARAAEAQAEYWRRTLHAYYEPHELALDDALAALKDVLR